jgi:outer membrane protein OmpA-like peptidoglycan-associated protein
MYKHIKLLVLFCLVIFTSSYSQTTTEETSINNSGWQFSLRGGYDLKPMYQNNTPYINYKGGLELGASVDYYWNWLGLGADFDYIKNTPQNTYPTSNLFLGSSAISNITISKDNITRTFLGIGPNFKYQKSNKFSTELKFRAGISNIKGGRLDLTGITTTLIPVDLNFHGGYDAKNILSGKAQIQFNYFFSNVFGIHAGAYYLHHFNVPELFDTSKGYSSGYSPFTIGAVTTSGVTGNVLNSATPNQRVEPCECDISSIGVFAGITLKLGKNIKEECCMTCPNFNLSVTARDKFTKELLPDTDVVVKNKNGEVIQTGKTNGYGVVVFNNVIPDDYMIEGKLYSINLETTTTVKSEFTPKETLQKEILYTDLNFILKGKAVVCNSTKPLNGVSVVLMNNANAEQKNTITDKYGEFIFSVKQNTEYDIYGRKEKYYSQTETVSTNSYNRNTTLFVKLEVCMEETDCGKSIVLKNILYDLDKYIIKDQAKKELNKLVRFMEDNPTIMVELSSHTDCRASNEYNATLSQNRANAAVDYIVSQGITRNRLVGKGYGETKLLNRCADTVDCSEAEHSINRRTEMKVICPDKN